MLTKNITVVITVVSSFTYITLIGPFSCAFFCLNKHGLRFISFILKSIPSGGVEGSQILTIRYEA